jgi:hypothetical protein
MGGHGGFVMAREIPRFLGHFLGGVAGLNC